MNNVFLHGADYNYEQWINYPEVLDKDLVYMKEVKANVMAIGIFSWSMLESEEGVYNFDWLDECFNRLTKNGQKIILATPSGAKPAWLSEKYPEVCKVNENGIREHHGYRHNHCRSSIVYRNKCKQINLKLAERYGKNPTLLMWHVSNEYNGCPCYCENCIKAFHEWLQKKYVTLEKLNEAWWTTFWSHRFTNWNQIFPNDKSIQGMMLDWQRFNSDMTIDFFENEIEPLKKITPNIPVTTNFQFPDVGLDYFEFAKHVDVISWDSYPDWHLYDSEINEACRTAFMHDMHRSFKQKPFLLMESSPSLTNWKPVARQKKFGMHKLASIQAIAHGSNSVQYFQWRQSRGGEEKFHSAVVSSIGTNNTRIFKDVTEVGNILEELSKNKKLLTTIDKSQVAIVYDIQNSWAIYGAGLSRNNKKNYLNECIKHYQYFWSNGIQCDIIGGELENLSQYKIVVLPMLYMFRENAEQKIRDYVAAGGIIVATYLSGVVDETDLCYLGGTPGKLTDVFGITVEQNGVINDNEKILFEYDKKKYQAIDYADLVNSTNSSVIAKFITEDFFGLPMITKNSFGKGFAFYISARTDIDFLSNFYENICDNCKIQRLSDKKLPEGISLQKRGDTLFIMNFSNNTQNVFVNSKKYKLNTLDVIIEDCKKNECNETKKNNTR